MYYIKFGIEIEKTWSFEFPTKFDYLAPTKISIKKNTTELATMTETETRKDVVDGFAKPLFSTTTSTAVELGLDVADTSDEATSMQISKAVEEQRSVLFPIGDNENLTQFLKLSDEFVMNTIRDSKLPLLDIAEIKETVSKRLSFFCGNVSGC